MLHALKPFVMEIKAIRQAWRENPNTHERTLVPVVITVSGEEIRLVHSFEEVQASLQRLGSAAALFECVTVFSKQYEERTLRLARISEYEGPGITLATVVAKPAEKAD